MYTYGMPFANGGDKKDRIPGQNHLKTSRLKGKSTSSQVLFGDINDNGIGNDVSQGKMLDIWAHTTSSYPRTSQRHLGAGNFGWLDGHVPLPLPPVADIVMRPFVSISEIPLPATRSF